MAVNKNDQNARECWGGAYDNIPKSVFALIAFHLANQASGNCDEPGAAGARCLEEITALAGSGIIDAAQARRALKTLGVTP